MCCSVQISDYDDDNNDKLKFYLHTYFCFLGIISSFKLALLVYKALHDATAAYLVDDCQLVSHAGRRRLHLADIDTCCVPWTNTRFGDRSRWTAALKQSAGKDSPARQ